MGGGGRGQAKEHTGGTAFRIGIPQLGTLDAGREP